MLLAHPTGWWPSFVKNWGIDGLELGAAGLCTARAFVGGRLRPVALAFGAGLLAWAAGDVVWSIETMGGATPPTPSWADALYLLFYPCAFVGVILIMRLEVRRLPLATWLDGAVAGLGAAAAISVFAFDTILHALGGSATEVATNLGYSIGDLVLLALVVGALAMLPTWRTARWLILALGCAALAVGDTVYLFQSSAGTYRVGTLLDATWPVAIVLVSVSVWVRSGSATRGESGARPRFVLPMLATACGIAVLFDGSLQHVSRVGEALALATLVTVVGRSLLSLRDLGAQIESRRRQALTDDLTGLGNRRLLLRVLDEFFADREGPADEHRRLALLLIDLDHFKEINDSFGHPVGDQVLKGLGPRLREVIRDSDVLARLGGDEFGIVLTDADVAYSTTVAERVTTQLEQAFTLDVASLHISASIGIALVPEHARSSAELLRCADVAMYRAKGAHRPFDVYDESIDDSMSRMRRIEQLRAAIADRALVLYFQPQFDLRSGDVVAAEALLRWPHSELGVISPADFIPLAEEAAHEAHDRAGPGVGVGPVRPLAPGGAPRRGLGQLVDDQPARRRAAGPGPVPPGPAPPRGRCPHPGDHRDDPHGRPGPFATGRPAAARPGPRHLRRRLRHGLLVPGLSERPGRR
jgi:diguanylate cyclase (GGDEF)-like protein